LAITALSFGLALWLGQLYGRWFGDRHLVDGALLGTPLGAGVGVLVYECCHYWYHRCAHRFEWLWRLGHQMHHSAETLDVHGRLDIFFANAGISGGLASIVQQSAEDWAEILRVNLIGPFLAIKYAVPVMRDQGGGSIVCTASVAGIRAGAGGAAYSASKAGVISLVQNAAQQFAGSNVRINAICPGLIETGMTKMMYDLAREKGQEARIGELNPLKRGGEPIEIANAALFLASDESSYVNGQALIVDGGLSSSHPYTPRYHIRAE